MIINEIDNILNTNGKCRKRVLVAETAVENGAAVETENEARDLYIFKIYHAMAMGINSNSHSICTLANSISLKKAIISDILFF
jgi:hypothetical protein